MSNGESNNSWLDSSEYLNASTLFPTEDPSKEEFQEGQDNSTSLDLVRTIILATASDFYTNPDMLSMDPASVHYKVMNWLMEDPSFSSYSSSTVLQRFALGVTYWSLAKGATDRTQVGWMDYNDECDWPSKSPSPCNSKGSIVAVNLEGMGFKGTLAPEIGLLTSLQDLDLHDNQITGTIPTEIGFLKNLGKISLGSRLLAPYTTSNNICVFGKHTYQTLFPLDSTTWKEWFHQKSGHYKVLNV